MNIQAGLLDRHGTKASKGDSPPQSCMCASEFVTLPLRLSGTDTAVAEVSQNHLRINHNVQ